MARKLRIAVSVFFAVLAVALSVLWATSYQWSVISQGGIPGSNEFISAVSRRGSLKVQLGTLLPGTHLPWELSIDKNKYSASIRERLVDEHFTFRAYSLPEQSFIQMPHWFAVMLSAALATLPWIVHRFSLRTLLIATTLFAVVLGLGVWLAS